MTRIPACTSALAVLALTTAFLPHAGAQEVIPADGAYFVLSFETTPVPGMQPSYIMDFVIENGQLTGSGKVHADQCLEISQVRTPGTLPVEQEFDGNEYPTPTVTQKETGVFLITTGIDLGTEGQFRSIKRQSSAATYGVLRFSSPTEATYSLSGAFTYFTGAGPEDFMATQSCLTHQTFAVRKR
jgi:hypothetical protein